MSLRAQAWTRAIGALALFSSLAACGSQPVLPLMMSPGNPVNKVPRPANCHTLCNEAQAAGILNNGPVYGRGTAWPDIDGDGWEDLWISSDGVGAPNWDNIATAYHNNHDGTFSRLELGIANEDVDGNWGGIWGDYDNDGDPDLFLVNGGYHGDYHLALYRNDLATTGAMTSVTQKAGILPDLHHWWGASWGDYDNDGFLDIVVTSGVGRDEPMPGNEPLLLYHNNRDGTFLEVGARLGLRPVFGDTKGPVWFDLDNDGDLDLYVPGRDQHVLFRNDGPSGFTEITDLLDNTHFHAAGARVEVFAAVVSDFNQDGWQDLYLGRQNEQDYIAINDQGKGFHLAGLDAGIDHKLFPDLTENTMGLGIGDVDGDGFDELVLGPGEPQAARLPMMFCHDAGTALHYHRCSDDLAGQLGAVRGHGPAFADYDHDGDMDLLFNLGGFVPLPGRTEDSRQNPGLFVNYPAAPLPLAMVRLQGSKSNRSAIGARITAHGSTTLHYAVHSAQGFNVQNGDWLPISLGALESASLDIAWPSGQRSTATVKQHERVTLIEP